jgi:membrane-associated phospholipid phosphatase
MQNRESEEISRVAAILIGLWGLGYSLAAFAGNADFSVLALVALTVAVAGAGSSGAAGRAGRILWPLFTWPLSYQASVEVIPLFPSRYIDPVLAAFDGRLFGLVGVHPLWQLGGPLEEVANWFYLSYYLGVPIGLLWAWKARGEGAAARYGLAMVIAFGICAAVWLAIPSGGWHLGGAPTNAGFGPATAFAHEVYARNPHHAAAFPSSHVAVGVASIAAMRELRAPRWLLLWPLAIAFATIYGQYHYTLDAAGGWGIGFLAARLAWRAQPSAVRVAVPSLRVR